MHKKNSAIKNFKAPKAKILIVDDCNVTLKFEEDLMRTYDIDVSIANSGEECINLVKTKKFDMIFIDHIMPYMDGIETVSKIRNLNDEYFKNVIIIALTAITSSNNFSMYIKSGFNDLLEKPLDNFKLNKILYTYLPKEYIFFNISAKPIDKKYNEIEIKIKNIDVQKAINNYSGSIDNYLSLLSVAYHDGKQKLKMIKAFADNQDIQRYTIEVHSLKTVAALIGDSNLSQLSKIHEIAGTNNDLDFILENVDSLLNTYSNLLNNIELLLPKENTAIKPKIKDFTNEHLSNLVNSIANSLDNFDLDSANESLTYLMNYDLPDAQISILNKVKEYMDIFDYDNAYELITNLNCNL